MVHGPRSTPPSMPLSRSDTEHLLRRVGFGATTAETDHFSGRQLGDVLDEMFARNPGVPTAPGAVTRSNWYQAKLGTSDWWVDRMAAASFLGGPATPSPLREKLALFWHSHFACGTGKVHQFRALWRQLATFHRHGLGDFERLLHEVMVDGAMLVFFDNHVNVQGREQENLARELMELHTIGVGNFTEGDVIAMAKAWTGHGVVDHRTTSVNLDYRFRSREHDRSQKSLFGLASRNWNGPDTIPVLVNGVKQDATARFIATKLWRYYVGDDPTRTDIDGLAATFVAGGMRIEPLLRAILSHPRFWSAQARWAMVRQPIEWATDILRRFDVSAADSGVTWLSRYMGQDLFRPPNVAGWGTNGYWVSTTATWGKARFLKSLRAHPNIEATFADIQHGSRAAAIDRILDAFGVTEPSTATEDRIGEWFDWLTADQPWAAPREAIYIGGLLPEVQTG